jgi:hypothetical protein
MSKRELHREKNKIKDACKYFKWENGEKVFFDKFSKVKKIRTKINDSKSNHGPWEYELTEEVQCSKKFKTNYGGTIKQGNSRSTVPTGKSKYFTKFGYQRRELITIPPTNSVVGILVGVL